jgi:two-component system nitrogen regulation response regulator GlnG
MDAEPASRAPAAPPGLAALVPRLADTLIASRPGRVYRELLAIVERPLIAHVLAATRGNQLRAARLLGLNRNTLRRRCRELGLLPSFLEAGPAKPAPDRRKGRLAGAQFGAPAPSEPPPGEIAPAKPSLE